MDLVKSDWVNGELAFKKKSDNSTLFTVRDDGLDLESGKLKIGDTAVTKTAAQLNALVIGVAAGYKLARGSVIATASATVSTGLTAASYFALTPTGDNTTKINNACAVSGKVSGANLIVYRFKASGASTTTLTAATTAGTVNWLAVGT